MEGNEIRIPWKYRLISLLIANAAADGALASISFSNLTFSSLGDTGLGAVIFAATVLLIGAAFWLPLMFIAGHALPPVWVFTLCGTLAGFLTPAIVLVVMTFMQGGALASAFVGGLALGLVISAFTVPTGAAGGAFCGYYLEYVRDRLVAGQRASHADPESF